MNWYLSSLQYLSVLQFIGMGVSIVAEVKKVGSMCRLGGEGGGVGK